MQYNQSLNGQSVRVGNWFEELKLKEETGIRYYPDPSVRENSLLTNSRCIVHTERMEPKDYKSVMSTTIVDPKLHPASKTRATVGPRQQLYEETLKKAIEDDIQLKTTRAFHENRKVDYSTTSNDSYGKKGFNPYLREKDISVRLPTRNTGYSTDEPITIYSQKVKDSSESVDFPTTFAGSINPFRKNCVFSADIVRDDIATRTESWERPQSLPTVGDYKILMGFRNNLLSRTGDIIANERGRRAEPGAAIRFVLNAFSDYDRLSIADIEQLLSDVFSGFTISASEKRALIAAYDSKSSDSLSIVEILMLFKRTPAPRRLELIGLFYNALDPASEGVVSSDVVESRFKSNGYSVNAGARDFLDFFRSTGREEFIPEEFFDYYHDASSEIESDQAFERLLTSSWDSV